MNIIAVCINIIKCTWLFSLGGRERFEWGTLKVARLNTWLQHRTSATLNIQGPCIFLPNLNPISREFWISANCIQNSVYVTKIQFSIWKLSEFCATDSSFHMTKNFRILTQCTSNFLQLRFKAQCVNFQILVQLTPFFEQERFWILTKPSDFFISKRLAFGPNWLQISYNGSLGFWQNARPVSYNYDSIFQYINFLTLVQRNPIFEKERFWILRNYPIFL